MENENKDENSLYAFYLGWAFLHLVFLAIGWNGNYHDDFWPFQERFFGGKLENAYDMSEFLVYVLGPVVILVMWALVDDGAEN